MYPQFEKTKIINDMVYCNIGNSLQMNSFGFGISNIDNVKLSKQLSIYVNSVKHARVCSLLNDTDNNLYLRFKRISNDFHDDMICQFFYKSKDFKCSSCNQFFQGQNLKTSCCSMKFNLLLLNDCEIYKINFLTVTDYNIKKLDSKIEFADLHFGSVIDTIILGDPV